MARLRTRADHAPARPQRRRMALAFATIVALIPPAPGLEPSQSRLPSPTRSSERVTMIRPTASPTSNPSKASRPLPDFTGETAAAFAPAATAAPAPPGTAPSSPAGAPTVPGRPAEATETAGDAVGPLGAITSPDVGEHCADDLGAEALTRFFSDRIGAFGGADYQRAVRLPDDRVLWTFQDAFIDGALLHNVAMVQSGRCFSRLGPTDRSWLLDDLTSSMRRWHWILDGVVSTGGDRVHLYVVEMEETGSQYLSRTRPRVLRRVVLDATTLEVVDIVVEPPTGDDLYGWSVTEGADFTYLYSHCYQQFGYETPLGFGSCAADVRLARVPRGQPESPRTFWDGTGWTTDHTDAVPVVDARLVYSGNNPAQIRFDGTRFVLVEKRDDWFGSAVEFASSDSATGPFRHVATVAEPLRCDAATCNSYFATWLPWTDDGRLIWSISHNRWDGTETATHLEDYRPTFHSIELPSTQPSPIRNVPPDTTVPRATSSGAGLAFGYSES